MLAQPLSLRQRLVGAGLVPARTFVSNFTRTCEGDHKGRPYHLRVIISRFESRPYGLPDTTQKAGEDN